VVLFRSVTRNLFWRGTKPGQMSPSEVQGQSIGGGLGKTPRSMVPLPPPLPYAPGAVEE